MSLFTILAGCGPFFADTNDPSSIACNCGSDFGVESHEALDAQSGVCGKSCTTGAKYVSWPTTLLEGVY